MKDFRGRLIFKCYTGSKLYGTDDEKSDTDIKGVFLPELKDLVLGKAPKCYQFSTGDNHVKNSKEDTDETYYSLHYFLELLSKGDTNALDLFFSYTNTNCILISDEMWNENWDLIKEKIITKNLTRYLSYVKSQSMKYSLKGDKLRDYKSFRDFLSGIENKTLLEYLSCNYEEINDFLVGENKKFPYFGEKSFFERAKNGNYYLVIHDIKFDVKESCVVNFEKVNRVIKSYGDRVNKVAKDNGVDYKALSHAVRVIFQVEELLKEGHITFPLKEREFIKSIKYKKTEMTFEEIIEWIEKKIEYIEKDLIPNSSLRDVSDFDWIENYLLKIYQ